MTSELLSLIAGKPLLVEPRALRALLAKLDTIDLQVVAPSAESFEAWSARRAQRPAYQVAGGAAVIPIRGLIMKAVPPILEWWGEILGWEFTGTEKAREAIATAIGDEAVSTIRLDIDSPGGSTDGLQDLADDIFVARELKRVEADVDGMMASAALWIGSQANTLSAGPSDLIGSIGTFTVVEDWSAAAEQAGVKVHVISNAPGKGWATGAPVPKEQLDNLQAIVDGLTDEFVGGIARGRGMKRKDAAKLATGDVWLGEEAKRRGLVDTVGPDRKAISTSGQEASQESGTMTDQEKKDLEARLAAVEAERDQLKADNEKATAEAAAANALIEASKTSALEALVTKYEDRVPPSARDAFLKLGAACENLAEFEGHLSRLPVVTRSEPIGDAGDDPEATPASTARSMTTEQRALCRLFGFKSWDQIERLGARGNQIKTDGTLIRADGSFVPPDEFRSFVEGKTQAVAAEELGFR